MGCFKIHETMKDQNYESIIVSSGHQVIGGCTFKCHNDLKMLELYFLGIKSTFHLFGLGTKLIESLFKYAQQ